MLGLAGCSSPILYSTVNTILKDDAEERALVVVSPPHILSPKAPPHPKPNLTIFPRTKGAMMSFGYSFNIWVPLLLFPTAGDWGAPRWKAGWPASIAFYALLWAGFMGALLLARRKRKAAGGEEDLESDATSSDGGLADSGLDVADAHHHVSGNGKEALETAAAVPVAEWR